ncbi:MAG: hypothetical protein K8R91_03810 [Phycisphaerae bacterium]|nr:hypothetical protein [Phycisphaerae bacterium]
MSKEKTNDAELDDLGGYVPAVYAHSFEQADWYCQLLEDHDIPAITDEDYKPPPGNKSDHHHHGVPILVPKSMLTDARECISQLDEIESFCQDDIDDEDETEFGPDNGFEITRNDDEENEYF